MGQELFETYPAFVQSGTKLLPLRNISKAFSFIRGIFLPLIQPQLDILQKKHPEIIELLKWGKENGHVNYSILEFVTSRK